MNVAIQFLGSPHPGSNPELTIVYPLVMYFLALTALTHIQQPLWSTFEGRRKRVVILTGDEEYRSEECMPQIAKILSKQHGFHCDVVYAIDKDGTINPGVPDNLPGIQLLERADLMFVMLRFRNLPDEQMAHFDRYVKSGKPIIGFRTSTHAFEIPETRAYAKYSWRSKEWEKGFGRQILGETWISHHGQHLVQSTRSIVAPGAETSPLLNGVGSIWVPTDVYSAKPLQPFTPLLNGSVRTGMKPTDGAVLGKQNEPMMPIAWTRTLGKQRVFTTTMGSGLDFQDENLRRLAVNACYWCLGMDVPKRASVNIVGKYEPSPIGFGKHLSGRKPE